jgi:membrane associated rhomboid family serine protease
MTNEPSEPTAAPAVEPEARLAEGGAPVAEPTPERFGYGAFDIVFGPAGFVAPPGRFRREQFVAYRDVTHVAVESRVVSIGTRHGMLLLGRAELGGDAAAHAFARALLARVLALPDGARRRDAFAALDRKLTSGPPRVALTLIALAVACFALQHAWPSFYEAAVYREALGQLGEVWRNLTTQFLHGNFAHLALNVVALGVAGGFVERAIGRTSTLFVVGFAALGTTAASHLASYAEVIGSSGIAAGLFGALTALELVAPEQVPAPARVPRGVLVSVLVAQVALDYFLPRLFPAWVPAVAGGAHVGGFVAGAIGALFARDSARALLRAGALATSAAGVAAFAAVALQLANPASASERQARALLEHPVQDIGALNNLAWAIATSRAPSAGALEAAAALAEAAVGLTDGAEPTILDTLAEVYFAQGRRQDALDVIDRAIALAPGETYYAEQRRRFEGARAAEDRPAPPEETPGGTPLAPEPEPEPERELEFLPGDEITV